MKILTQNFNNIITLNELRIEAYYQEHKITYEIINYNVDERLLIGRYETKERAKEILLEIINKINKNEKTYIMPIK